MTPPCHADQHRSHPGRPGTVLHIEWTGDGAPLVLVHGFTQTGRLWGGLDALLAAGRRLGRVDLPGHGGSGEVRAGLPDGAALLGAAGGPGAYLGYSMGARYCLQLAVARPDLVRRLVLVSGTAGIDDADERAARRRADEALAERLDPVGGGPPEDTVATFVDRWVADPLFGEVAPAAQGVAERLRNSAAGLAASLRLAGTGTMEPLWERLGDLAMPVLVVTGGRDGKFTALGSRLAGAVGSGARLVVVGGADHAPHLQRTDEVAAAVREFLEG
ncbi:MAG: alpha/beta fold hydrolase [Acidimicrobiales bacterium]